MVVLWDHFSGENEPSDSSRKKTEQALIDSDDNGQNSLDECFSFEENDKAKFDQRLNGTHSRKKLRRIGVA